MSKKRSSALFFSLAVVASLALAHGALLDYHTSHPRPLAGYHTLVTFPDVHSRRKAWPRSRIAAASRCLPRRSIRPILSLRASPNEYRRSHQRSPK
ncbi:MAG: hypothetical protein ABI551_16715 [Polyangiaceae bacterium]